MQLTSLVYLIDGDEVLMLHRTKKANDINHNKWLGVGGKFEWGESPLECARREVKEETGQDLLEAQARGVITFFFADDEPLYIFLYTGRLASRQVIQTYEGDLEWVKRDQIPDLELWEGDRIFLKKLFESDQYIDMKLSYDAESRLLACEDFSH
ncbi:NUDIX hydrolase [Aerococcus sanguinicola]|uniref:8-oxo-dGTP diphosphatase n=2 Tax=Aerococcus sanguinicola TaxID=119206 RepID=A0A2I1MQR5_9LACT|nr:MULTISPECIES: 8-oxo-dGTP diphosphatase [Aerococcus]MDK7049915.1 8-oxo-dGTP diphosphatase [Aerococcus sanguinicola]PKZ22480.1 8-oxo-dGTP diphosphatase [Aerococcus sanguinicola]